MGWNDLVLTPFKLGKALADGLISWLVLRIQSIEVTQAVQYLDADEHMTDPADRGPDNGIKLVAGKPAWVRVYLRSTAGASGVTGSLEVKRRTHGFLWNTVTTLSPDPSSATSVPEASMTTYADTRGNLSRTLNFVIPAAEMFGVLRLIARASADTLTVTSTVDVTVTLRQTLRLAGVMISYNGPASMAPNAPNLTIAAPTLVDLQAMAGTALTMFPVESTAEFRTAGTLVQANHLQDTTFPTTGCGTQWDALHGAVANARTADGNQPGWIYYGLLPAGVPMGPVGGCGGGGVAVGPINQPGTLAHEAGHACGLEHAPAGGAPNPDPSYPAYEPYDPANTPQASIGEYGVNVNNGSIASPQTFRDFMAYGGPSWISPYHYGRLLDNGTLSPTTVGVDDWWWKDLVWEELKKWPPIPEPDPPFDLELAVFPPWRMQNVISMILKVEDGEVTDVMHVARTQAHTVLPQAAETPFTAQLRDTDGSVLATGTVLRLKTALCGSGGSGRESESTTYIAQAFLADVGAGARLEIRAGDEVVWRREAPAEPPRIEAIRADVDREGSTTLSWESSGEMVEFWVRWSLDGKTWQPIVTGLKERALRMDATQLPSGDGLLQVVAHDGFFSSHSDPVPVSVPTPATHVAILHPVQDHTYLAGHTLRLWASVVGATEELSKQTVWLVDGSEVARGLDAWVTLEPGRRTVTVRLGDRSGTEASVTVIIVDSQKPSRSSEVA